jgi:preprotein translocase subunit SecY
MKENIQYPKIISPRAVKDLGVILFVTVLVFILSFRFNLFSFIVKLFNKYPKAITWIDEFISISITLIVCFAVFSWRRLVELRKETAERIRLQGEIIKAKETQLEIEEIISKQLRCEIEERRK